MNPKISRQDFEVLLDRTGLPLSAGQRAALHAPYAYIEAMVARVHAPRPREAEPAVLFRVEDAAR